MDPDQDKTFYTVTMARVFASQGRYDAAARIYRYLLEQSPGRTDLRQALDDVLSMMPQTPAQWQTAAERVACWVRLMLRSNMLARLQQIRLPGDR